jgi:putative tricarboxylic transport membrane protein
MTGAGRGWARRRLLITATALGLLAGGWAQPGTAAELDKIHFLIPGGAGGGWDGTARGVGEALTKSGLIGTSSYQNLSGGGGGKAIAHLIETAQKQQGTLMVNSTPIIIRSLQKVFPQSFRDLTPIAAVIADYGAFVVRADSPYQSWQDVLDAYKAGPEKVKIAGGSVRGSMDHLVAAMAFQAAGEEPMKLRYVAYDAGGKALAGLLSGETQVLSTGLGEALSQHKQGQVRILAVTAEQRVGDLPDVPTLKELGYDAIFANWRGFFGAPGLPEDQAEAYAKVLGKMYQTDAWEAVRSRNGWGNLFKPRADFVAFLKSQETVMGELMRQLGVLQN